METIMFPWTAEVVLISWRSVRNNKRPPLPSEFLASFVIFGAFSIVATRNERVASVLGWGVVVATALNFFPRVTGVPASGAGPSLTANTPGDSVNRFSSGGKQYSAYTPPPSVLNQYPGGI